MLKKALTTASVIFTAMVMVYAVIILLVYSADPDSSLAISAARIALFFPFALAFALANRILEIKSLDSWLRTVLHFIITALAFYLCLLLPLDEGASVTFVGLSLFLVVYAIVVAILAIRRSRAARAENDARDYTPVYRKSIDKK